MGGDIEVDGTLPLGLFKQAYMKLDSFVNDLHEIIEDDGLTDTDKNMINEMIDMAALMGVGIITVINREISEEDFIGEDIDMDKIDPYPEDDIMNQEI